MNTTYSSRICMLKEEGNSAAGGGGGGQWVQACDSCQSAPSTVYCRADAAYLCVGCDARVHAANRVASRHERVWVCEACERAPATLTCRADAAALCAACDAKVHSANPLAGRHHRVPILPLPPGHLGPGPPLGGDGLVGEEPANHDGGEATSWLLLNGNCNQTNNSGFLLGGEADEYLDLVEYNDSGNENQNQEQQQLPQMKYGRNEGSERVVPSQRMVGNEAHQLVQQHNNGRELDYEHSINAGFSYNASLSHNVCFSSMEASVVPDATMTDISNSHLRPSKGLSTSSLQMPPQSTPMDREARVLRYREKKKTRKFEKTIRYASRKAYAETRPRIKGRFAKISDIELDVDRLFSSSLISEGSYDIVPSF